MLGCQLWTLAVRVILCSYLPLIPRSAPWEEQPWIVCWSKEDKKHMKWTSPYLQLRDMQLEQLRSAELVKIVYCMDREISGSYLCINRVIDYQPTKIEKYPVANTKFHDLRGFLPSLFSFFISIYSLYISFHENINCNFLQNDIFIHAYSIFWSYSFPFLLHWSLSCTSISIYLHIDSACERKHETNVFLSLVYFV
jgi:hypothetical protein